MLPIIKQIIQYLVNSLYIAVQIIQSCLKGLFSPPTLFLLQFFISENTVVHIATYLQFIKLFYTFNTSSFNGHDQNINQRFMDK